MKQLKTLKSDVVDCDTPTFSKSAMKKSGMVVNWKNDIVNILEKLFEILG